MGEPVGDFYVHLVQDGAVSKTLTSSTKLLTLGQRPTVIHFYDGGWGGCRPTVAQMERWAQNYGLQVQFLCVCVDRSGVALEFGRMFNLRHAVNGWIPSRQYFPVGYGQLGCSGFIISDQKGHFVSRKTKAYLDFGDDAYGDVEQILKNTLGISATSHTRSHGSSNEGEEDVMSPNFVLPSVGIGIMDHEHTQCELALATLLAEPTAESLTKALAELTGHFQHEEKLMRSNNFGNPGKEFSPYANHVKDHERILDLGYSELSKYESRKSSDASVAIDCDSNAQWHKSTIDNVDLSVVEKMVKEFRLHATRFDKLYEGKIKD